MLRYLLLSFLVAAASATNVQRCTANSGNLPSSTRIEGCTNPPCVLPQQQDAVIHLTFTANRDMNSMQTIATAHMGPLTIPYPLGNAANTCNHITNTRCPIRSGTTVNYTLRFRVQLYHPVGTEVTVEFRIEDQNRAAVVCVRVPIRVAAPRQLAAEDAPHVVESMSDADV